MTSEALPDDYSGAFNPDFGWHHLSRRALSIVGRELMLAAHLQDRAGIPAAMSSHGTDAAWGIAIAEWMGASPVYTQRMQHLLDFEGEGVPTIFKGLQLDVGFPHQFLDVHFELQGEHDGEFWLSNCGALRDVQPMGTEMVKMMCHDVEDPTFDATAVATNPRAQVRPFHRPPEIPHGGPDCHWSLRIRPDFPEVQPHPLRALVGESHLAQLSNVPHESLQPGGLDSYHGAFSPGFQLEDLSHAALQLVAREFAIQGHLLARSYCLAVTEQWSAADAENFAAQMWTGVGWIESERLVPALGLDPDDVASIAKVMQCSHVVGLSDYLGLTISMPDDGTVRVEVADCPALHEGDGFSVTSLLMAGAHEILLSVARGVNPTAVVESAPGADLAAWHITLGHETHEEFSPVSVVRFSTGPQHVFIRRKPIRD